jgi:hypothetical protein
MNNLRHFSNRHGCESHPRIVTGFRFSLWSDLIAVDSEIGSNLANYKEGRIYSVDADCSLFEKGPHMSHQRIKRAALLGVQIEGGDHPVVESNDEFGLDWESQGAEETLTSEHLYKRIADSKKLDIKNLIDSSLGYRSAKIREIQFEEDQLVILLSLPFLLLPTSTSQEPGEHPYPRREQKRIREDFAKYLMEEENEKKLSHFLCAQLVDFRIKVCNPKKPNPAVEKYLRKISQRILAGRPIQVIPPKILHYIRHEGKPINKLIRVIQSQVKIMKKRNKDLTNATIVKKLSRKHPSSTFPWMPVFLKMKNDLPRRRYSPSVATGQEIPESADPDGKLPLCNLSEPDDWSTLETTTRVIRAKLLAETNVSYPLREIRALIKST